MGKLGRSLLKSLRSANRDARSTWDLYKDESLKKRIKMVLYTCDLLDPVFDSYYATCNFFIKIQRLIEYAPVVWHHRNWDHGFVLLFEIKLYEDLYKGCFVEGNHVVHPKEALRLKTVIALLKRLHADDYDSWHYDYLERKYGKSEIYFRKIAGTEGKPGGPYSTMGCTREDNLTEQQQRDYLKERKRMWVLEEAQRKQDLELLGKYIAKYSRKWWD